MYLFIQNSYSQWGNPIHYTQNNGLSTQSMFTSAIDSLGFVWFASESGASRFNGKEFEHFKANEGILSNSLLTFAIDKNNTIWANSLTGEIYCYKNGKWYEKSKKSQPYTGKNTLYIYNEDLIVFTGKKVYKCNLNQNNQINTSELLDFTSFKDGPLHFTIKENQFVVFYCGKLIFYNPITLKKEVSKSSKQEYVFFNGELYLLDKDITKIKLPLNLFIHAIEIKNKKLYVASSQGFYIFDQINDTVFKLDHSFNLNIPCVDFELDKNNNLWICSQFDGVYFYPKILGDIFKYEELKGDVLLRTLPNPKGGFKHLTSFGKLVQSTKNKFVIENNFNVTSYDLQHYNNEFYTLTSNKLLVNNKIYSDSFFWYKSLFIDKNSNEVFIGCGDRLMKALPKFEELYNFDSPNRIYGLLKVNKKFVLGTDNGVFSLYENKVEKYDLGKFSNLKNVTQILITQDSVYAFKSKNLGVLLKFKGQYLFLKEQKELSSEPNFIQSPKPGLLLIGAKNGLNYITYSSNPLRISRIKVFSIYNGLYDYNINHIHFDSLNNDLFITYNNSIQRLKLNELENVKTNFKLYIKSISNDNKKIFDFNEAIFNYNENDVELEFNSIDYIQESKKGYLYRLSNLTNKWSEISGNVVKFSDLPPGEYVFELKLRIGVENNDTVTSCKFVIKPAFWQLLWFKLLIALLITSLIYWALRKRYRRLITKELLKNKLEKEHSALELEAIKAQINPHFIYNCLNSIQYSILKNDNVGAEKQLSTFSKLVRETLDYSKMDFISLEQEMNYLEKYLQMEKLRFKDSLEYDVITSIIDKDNVQIPCLLIQPFVENAIKHGLSLNENEVSYIKVCFTQHGERVICKVEDSGSGINMDEIKEKEMPSGMKLSNKRAETYNNIYNMDIQIKIVNKTKLEKYSHGTMAIISIPLRKKF